MPLIILQLQNRGMAPILTDCRAGSTERTLLTVFELQQEQGSRGPATGRHWIGKLPCDSLKYTL